MTAKEVIQAIAKHDIHDMLTPFSVAMAIEIASKRWTSEDTLKYGVRVRDVIMRLHKELILFHDGH